jgi:tRNA 2-selenouridine synthase
MANRIEAGPFLSASQTTPVVDVRSPAEYRQGHIPGAVNIPLFDDRERALIGTLYKNSGREVSVLKGLEIAGPKLSAFVKQLMAATKQKEILVHCWRGGMRSESMAWLFEQAGFSVSVLEGGYKAYRKHIRTGFSKPLKMVILGGLTGCGKTEILHILEELGEQVLDLERLAAHKGSVFGGLDMPDQPTNEQFENSVYSEWNDLDPDRLVWIEDESRAIGRVSIPDPLFDQMNRSPMILLETSDEERIRRLVGEYSILEKKELERAILKISEKLGGANTSTVLDAVATGDFHGAVERMLVYYDKAYAHSIRKRINSNIANLETTGEDPVRKAAAVLEKSQSFGFPFKT